jgi:predicted acyltransferase
MSTVSPSRPPRIASLDQFRGYTVAGMLLVNFIGGFQAVGAIWKHHHTYCSYADTIMPQFFFAVGFAFRLTFLRRMSTLGAGPTARAAIVRCLGLILLGLVLYHLDGRADSWEALRAMGWRGVLAQGFQREPFQTLVHIGLTSLWVMPVIASGKLTRVLFLVGSGLAHLALSHAFYFQYAWSRPVIDGGPLGFLTWAVPTLVGSLAYDAVADRSEERNPVPTLLAWSAVLMALGYLLASAGGAPATPPFVRPAESDQVDLWTMSQRTGSLSYLTFSAGFSLAIYALFVVLCDRGNLDVGIFRTFGQNALAAYIVHPMVAGAVKPYVPDDAPLWYALAAFLLYFGICYLFIRSMEKKGVFLRL